MCESQANGGQRCSAHTRPEYAKAMGVIQLEHASNSVKTRLTEEERTNLSLSASAHASTVLGAREIEDEIRAVEMIISDRLVLEDNVITDLLEILSTSLAWGLAQREVNKSVKDSIALANKLSKNPGSLVELKKREDSEFMEHNKIMRQIAHNLSSELRGINNFEDDKLADNARGKARELRKQELKRYERVTRETERLKLLANLAQSETED